MVPQSDPPSIVTGTAEGGRLNTEAQEIVATIERVFATLGEDDQVGLKEILCDDFHAFENGVRVTSRELLDLMSRYHAEGRRYRWSVHSPQIEVEGNLAVVVYVNHGSITEAPGSDPIPMSWLETVVLLVKNRDGASRFCTRPVGCKVAPEQLNIEDLNPSRV